MEEFRLKCSSCGREDFTFYDIEWAEFLLCPCGRFIDKIPVKKKERNFEKENKREYILEKFGGDMNELNR